jgi:hypothetical protein
MARPPPAPSPVTWCEHSRAAPHRIYLSRSAGRQLACRHPSSVLETSGAVTDARRGGPDLPAALARSGGLATIRSGSPLGPFENGPGAVLLVLLSAVVVGAGMGLDVKFGAAALVAMIAGLTILLRPTTAVLTVVAVAPVACALKRSLIVPGLRPSEALIAGVATRYSSLLGPVSRSRGDCSMGWPSRMSWPRWCSGPATCWLTALPSPRNSAVSSSDRCSSSCSTAAWWSLSTRRSCGDGHCACSF